jgi:RNA polymerase sigma-70 factor (ECF subfamily)
MVIQWEDARDMIQEDTRGERGARLLESGQSGLIRVGSVRGESASDHDVNHAMERYAAGDDAAFSELYDLIAPRLYGYLLRKTRNQSAAEDLLQQTMLRIHCARSRFIRGAQVMPWAISIARRLVIDGVRREKFECSAESDEYLEQEWALEAIDCPADEALHTKEVAQMVAQVLAKLPEAQQAAFELVKHDGLSHAEAAQVLGTTVTAIKLRAHRTYDALRTALKNFLEVRDL